MIKILKYFFFSIFLSFFIAIVLALIFAPEDREWVKCSDEKDLYRYVYDGWKIDKVLKQSFVTISFSSSVIEDSLNSKIPVILFDKWKRYKHCETNIGGNLLPIFYVNDLNSLSKKIDFIQNNYSNLNFKLLLNGKNIKNNIQNLFKKLEA